MMGMDESEEAKNSIVKFVDETLALQETKKNPAMVAAIAELVKAFYLLP